MQNTLIDNFLRVNYFISMLKNALEKFFFFEKYIEGISPDEKEKITVKKIRITLVLVTVGFFVFGGFIWGSVSYVIDDLRSPHQLGNIKTDLITRVYSKDSVMLKEFSYEIRIPLTLDTLSKETRRFLLGSFLSIEDNDFFNHWGISVKRTLAAVWTDILAGRAEQGASTITQQLTKNLFYASKEIGIAKKTISRKLREAITAIRLEKTYTKKEIFEMYLNQVYMGAGAYGIEAASEKYFSKNANELSLSEIACFAGMVQRPNAFRPDRHMNAAIRKRDLVLRRMLELEYIDSTEYSHAVSAGLNLRQKESGIGKAPYFVEMIRRHLEDEYGTKQLYTGGLSVYTTLNYNHQQILDSSVSSHLSEMQAFHDNKFIKEPGLWKIRKNFKLGRDSLRKSVNYYLYKHNLPDNPADRIDSLAAALREFNKSLDDTLQHRVMQTCFLSMDSKTGAVLAFTGGRDYAESKFIRTTQAFRQPGSSVKPFVYSYAISRAGYSPASVLLDQAFSIKTKDGMWTPENYNRKFEGPCTLRRGLAVSKNLIAIKLLMKIGPANVIRHIRNFGVDTRFFSPVPSMAIGSAEILPIDNIHAYSAFANYGIQPEIFCIDSIRDRNGNLLESSIPEYHTVLDSQSAYIMSSMLSSALYEGTGLSAIREGFDHPGGGKTGTTNDYTDAWYIGFTRHITAGVWVGCDQNHSMGRGRTGSSAALPIWTDYMIRTHENIPKEDFQTPSGIIKRDICKETGLLSGPLCKRIRHNELFTYKTLPDSTCYEYHLANKDNIDPFRKNERKRSRKDTTSNPPVFLRF